MLLCLKAYHRSFRLCLLFLILFPFFCRHCSIFKFAHSSFCLFTSALVFLWQTFCFSYWIFQLQNKNYRSIENRTSKLSFYFLPELTTVNSLVWILPDKKKPCKYMCLLSLFFFLFWYNFWFTRVLSIIVQRVPVYLLLRYLTVSYFLSSFILLLCHLSVLFVFTLYILSFP